MPSTRRRPTVRWVRSPAPLPAALVDIAGGIVAAVSLLVEAAVRSHGTPLPLHLVMAGITGGCLATRRRAPLASLAATLGSLLLLLPTMHSTHTALAVAMVSAGTVAYQGKRPVSLAVAGTLVPVVAVAWWVAGGDGDGQDFFTYLMLVLAAVVAGDAVRSRRDVIVVRREREVLARQAAARQMFDEYRLELGRELHDSLAHALVAITTRAGVAAHLGAAHGDPGLLTALADVKQVSADALAELRETLHTLRANHQAPVGPGRSARHAFAALVAPLTAAGLDVRLTCDDAAEDTPKEVSHAGYRIVQESLTNVLRHGQAQTVTVAVHISDGEMAIDVANDGPYAVASASRGAGHGLVGMAERAAHLGGTLHAGPRTQGGWQVCARLPLAGATA